MLTHSHLFEARTSGYTNYRIPGIVTAPDGTVLAYCEARQGRGDDWDLIDILMRQSLDHGATWQPPQRIIRHEDYTDGGVHNAVAIADRITGAVHLLFCRDYAHVYYTYSLDRGRTFAGPAEITSVFDAFRPEYDWNVCAVGPGHGIQLQTGRLLATVWLSTGGKAHRPSMVSIIYSDDHGKSWQRGPMVATNKPPILNPSETAAVELADGRVLLNIRSESQTNRRLIALSQDGGESWSAPRFDDGLREPVCMGSLLGLKHTPGAILFVNPDNLQQFIVQPGGVSCDRKNLTVKQSHDGGRSWAAARVIEPGVAGYADLAEAQDGIFLCFYEDNFVERMTDPRFLTVARFPVTWISAQI